MPTARANRPWQHTKDFDERPGCRVLKSLPHRGSVTVPPSKLICKLSAETTKDTKVHEEKSKSFVQLRVLRGS